VLAIAWKKIPKMDLIKERRLFATPQHVRNWMYTGLIADMVETTRMTLVCKNSYVT
jgi:hypothetical protein